mmetsp:Transcript_775/g.1393  ORF Transcript_775/g.1393 Transcript_775/m.1393 type:complete len:394 (-) Transcript_775:103-1284(-)
MNKSSNTSRKPARCSSLSNSLTSSGSIGVCSTALWENKTSEARDLFQEYKVSFKQHDVNNTGKISIDAVGKIVEEAFNERPTITSIVNVVDAFSADDSSKLNLAEFTTMMHYIGECVILLSYSFGYDAEEEETKMNADYLIAVAINMYNKTSKTIQARLVDKLSHINPIINMVGVESNENLSLDEPNPLDPEFSSIYGPNQMRCLALVSHNGMKDTMVKFVCANKNVLKKFRLTGTKTTMAMLKDVFEGDNMVYGPSCESGPLGGDAQLVSMICKGQLGGVIFFQDPLGKHPHGGDIESLLRSIMNYNIMHASTTVSAAMLMHTLRHGLKNGMPELLPSFFTTLKSTSIESYNNEQTNQIARIRSVGNINNKTWGEYADVIVEQGIMPTTGEF